MHYSERAIELLEAVIEADKTLALMRTDSVHTFQKTKAATNRYRESVEAFIRQVTADYEKTKSNEIDMEHVTKLHKGKPRPPKGIKS